MLKQYEELAVLEQGDDGAVVSIRGQGGPSVLLSASYLGHLEVVLRRARGELSGVPSGESLSALRLLCAEVSTLLATHQEACNKFEGRPPASKSLAQALEELKEMREALNAL
jgi:hypothetical protein